jgi:ribosomal protein S18 acetylase RimI-like enzyme
MSRISISTDKRSVKPEEAAALYIALGWGTSQYYSAQRMKRSLEHCSIVVSARNEDGELIGIMRGMSDFAIDTKIFDMVIDPDYQRSGIGSAMMKKMEMLVKGTSIYFETEKINFSFAAKHGYEKRGGLTVFVKKT